MGDTIKLEPGVLVGLSVRVDGGVEYEKEPLEERTLASGKKVTVWKTTKAVARPEEHEEANKLRDRARQVVAGACTKTPFGSLLFCAAAREPLLDQKLLEAQALIDAFNARVDPVPLSKLLLLHVRGTIANSKGEATAAVSADMAGLLEQLDKAISAGAVGDIRDLCTDLRQRGKLLDQECAAKTSLDKALRQSRIVARKLKKAADAGDNVAGILQAANMSAVAAARFIFVKGAEPVPEVEEGPSLPAVADARFAGITPGGGDVVAGEAAQSTARAFLVAVDEAVDEYGTHGYDAGGPAMHLPVGQMLHRLEQLTAGEAGDTLLLVRGESDRGAVLADYLLEKLGDERVDEVFKARPALRAAFRGEQTLDTAGVVVPLRNLGDLIPAGATQSAADVAVAVGVMEQLGLGGDDEGDEDEES